MITHQIVQNLVTELEKELRPLGYHVGLTGSQLYGMGTGKDIDIIIYPHQKQDKCNYSSLEMKLKEMGFSLYLDLEPIQEYSRYVVITKRQNIRVDFFLFNV